jgi:septation ring formation regulator EzrA
MSDEVLDEITDELADLRDENDARQMEIAEVDVAVHRLEMMLGDVLKGMASFELRLQQLEKGRGRALPHWTDMPR